MSKEQVLGKVRSALGRTAGQPIPTPPPALLRTPMVDPDARVLLFQAAFEKLNGKFYRTANAKAVVEEILAGRDAVASNSTVLRDLGIVDIPGVVSQIFDKDQLREHCATRAAGISSADYAIADTGTLVMLSSSQEARMISLLPPIHIAVVPRSRFVTNLNELLSMLNQPAEQTSAMVLITGPSRTADIEQILIQGVHGPGEIHVVVVD
jgi:L-lactate dehydrogenase complex protein LldG